MRKPNQKLFILAALPLMLGLVACGGGMQGGVSTGTSLASNDSLGSGGNTPAPIVGDSGEVDMKALNADLDAMEAEMQSVENQVMAIDVFGSTSSSGQMSGLDKSFRTVFEKLYVAVSKVKEKTDGLKTKVLDRIAKLDPANPLHAIALLKLQEALTYLDSLGPQVDAQVLRIAGVLDRGVQKVDTKLAEMDDEFKKALVFALWLPLKGVVIEYRDKFLSLVDAST